MGGKAVPLKMKKNKDVNIITKSTDASADFIVSLIPICIMSIYLNGLRALVLLILGVFTAFMTEWFIFRMRSMRYAAKEKSSILYAMIFTMLLPATIPYFIVVIGVIITVMLGKHVFGGAGNYPFNPAALGFAVATVSWPQYVFQYSQPFDYPSVFNTHVAASLADSVSTLTSRGISNISTIDLIIGNYAGPIGVTSCLVIVSSLLYLIVKKRVDLRLSISFVLSCAAVSLLLPQDIDISMLELLKYDMLSGAIIFGAVYLVSNATTAPKNKQAKIAYGMLCGVLTMMFKHYGAYELGICFAILLTNAFSGVLDRKFGNGIFYNLKAKKLNAKKEGLGGV